MRTTALYSNILKALLKKNKIATLPELKKALNTKADKTIFRKLNELSYKTSYSHRGKYYTLEGIARYNNQGLWSFQSVRFSKYGNLLETVKAFVDKSEAGYSSRELDKILNVISKEALLGCLKKKKLYREKVSGVYIYCSIDKNIQNQQLFLRRDLESKEHLEPLAVEELLDELKASIIIFFSTLDEKQRRLFAGLESLKIGRGGDKKISEIFGLSPHTVAKGRDELLSGDFDKEYVRKYGGGRKNILKKNTRSNKQD